MWENRILKKVKKVLDFFYYTKKLWYNIGINEEENIMFKKERMNNYKKLVDSYKEIDKKIIDIKVAIHDLDKIAYNEDLDFIKELEKQLEDMNIEFYKLKQEIIKKVEKL